MIMSRTKIDAKLCKDQMRIGDNLIEWVSSYKYLGIIFTNKKNIFDDNLTYLKNKAIRAIGDIRTNIRNIIGPNRPFNLMMKSIY